MTDINETANTEQAQSDAIDGLDIATLRRFASIMKIRASRDWSKEDYVAAIKAKQESSAATTFVFDSSSAPAPGKARVIIHRDPNPQAKNSPVHLGVNGYIIAVPRGIEVDIPHPFVEALKNAKTTEVVQAGESSRENPGGIYKDEQRDSYPYQVIAFTPGEFVNPHDARAAKYTAKKKFFDQFGSWPTDAELKEVQKRLIESNIK